MKIITRFQKAQEFFEKSIRLFPFYGNYFEYAFYLSEQNQHHKSIKYFKAALNCVKENNLYSTVLNNLGVLYSYIQQHQHAEAFFTEALEIYRRLAQKNPAAFEPEVAMTLNNLGNLYNEVKQYQQAEAAFTEALEIRRRLAENNPAAFEPDVAMTLDNLGILYNDIKQYQQAEAFYTEALEIYRKLAQNNPAAFEPDVAGMLDNLILVIYTVMLTSINSLKKPIEKHWK